MFKTPVGEVVKVTKYYLYNTFMKLFTSFFNV